MNNIVLFQEIDIVLSSLGFIALVFYVYFTYRISKDIYEPFVSFRFEQRTGKGVSLDFYLMNKSKVEVEVFGKLLCKINNEIFESNQGFYNDKHTIILQPFTDFRGYLDLKKISDKNGVELHELILKKVKSIEFTFQIKYRKIGSKKWKKSSPYRYVYNFRTNIFYLKV